MKSTMQRLVLIVYSLSLAYCFTWIPWTITTHDLESSSAVPRLTDYGWLWDRPQDISFGTATTITTAVPDLAVIVLRVLAFSAVAFGAWLAAPLLPDVIAFSLAAMKRIAVACAPRRRRIAIAIGCVLLIAIAATVSLIRRPPQLDLQDLPAATRR